MKLKTIFVDFNNVDSLGRVRLNTVGSIKDIKNKKIRLENNLKLVIDDDDGLKALAIIEYSEEENIWVARIAMIPLVCDEDYFNY